MNQANLDKAYELISQVAFALRMSNSYSSEGRPYITDDNKWLTEASLQLNLVSQAIDNPDNINPLLEKVITSFEEYLHPAEPTKPLAIDSFKRWEIDIDEAISLLKSLKR